MPFLEKAPSTPFDPAFLAASEPSFPAWRTPLLEPAWAETLRRLRQHPAAPHFNHTAGDRLEAADVKALKEFRQSLEQRAPMPRLAHPSGLLLERLTQQLLRVPRLRALFPVGIPLARYWEQLPTSSRADLAQHPEQLVPDDVPLERLIVYRTAGTTGHALLVPHDVRAAAAYQPLIEYALSKYGVTLPRGPEQVVCFLLGCQVRTVTYPCNLSYFDGAGFAKLNLNAAEWPSEQAVRDYLCAFDVPLLTGDPLTFAELLRMDLPLHPRALLTTAVALSAPLKRALEVRFGCPVIDWYSLTETGPLGYACPRGYGYHQLSSDLFLEVVDGEGQPLPPGVRGEVTVSGGRNPFFPLFRYRTGDWGQLDFELCPCGDPFPRLLELEGRAPVVLRSAAGQPVNTVDISRVLREFPIVQHELIQVSARRIELKVKPLEQGPPLRLERLREALQELFGVELEIQLQVEATLGLRAPGAGGGDGKLLPYQSRLLLEE